MAMYYIGMKLTIFLTLIFGVSASAQSLDYLSDAGTLQVSKMMTFTINSVVSDQCRASWIENATLTGHKLPVTEVKWSVPLDAISNVAVEPNDTYRLWQVTLTGDFKSQEVSRYGNPGVVSRRPTHSVVVEDRASADRLAKDFNTAIAACK